MTALREMTRRRRSPTTHVRRGSSGVGKREQRHNVATAAVLGEVTIFNKDVTVATATKLTFFDLFLCTGVMVSIWRSNVLE